jgi:hypothetical protein
MNKLLLFGLLITLPAMTASSASLTGLWLFDNGGNPGQATVGTDLSLMGAAPGTWSATLADDQNDILGGVVTTPAAVSGNRFVATHGIAPNGGGTFVNEYSIVVDMFSPVASRAAWRTILQTNTGNANDGDYFIRDTDDALGVGALTYSGQPVNETSWTRLVVTFDLEAGPSSVLTYIDGGLWHTHTLASGGLDGRFSLDPTVLFFSDENGDNAPLNIGAVAIFDGVLSPGEVSALGAAGAPIPEPGTALFGVAALLGMPRRRRR